MRGKEAEAGELGSEAGTPRGIAKISKISKISKIGVQAILAIFEIRAIVGNVVSGLRSGD